MLSCVVVVGVEVEPVGPFRCGCSFGRSIPIEVVDLAERVFDVVVTG